MGLRESRGSGLRRGRGRLLHNGSGLFCDRLLLWGSWFSLLSGSSSVAFGLEVSDCGFVFRNLFVSEFDGVVHRVSLVT